VDERARSGGRILVAWQELRQRRFPPEFRITAAAWPADLLAVLQPLEHLQANAPRPNPEPDAAQLSTPKPSTPEVPAPWDEQAVANTVTSLWRARRKVETEDSVGPLRQVGRHVQAAWDSLERLGVKVLDHDGEPFHAGLSLDVLATQPHPGISRETVIETVKPTIYLNDRFVQKGQVIVGIPEGGMGS
jgi:hypothetical protein